MGRPLTAVRKSGAGLAEFKAFNSLKYVENFNFYIFIEIWFKCKIKLVSSEHLFTYLFAICIFFLVRCLLPNLELVVCLLVTEF